MSRLKAGDVFSLEEIALFEVVGLRGGSYTIKRIDQPGFRSCTYTVVNIDRSVKNGSFKLIPGYKVHKDFNSWLSSADGSDSR